MSLNSNEWKPVFSVNWYEDNPTVVYEFEVDEFDRVKGFGLDRIQSKNYKTIHLEMIGDKEISLLAANEVVEWFEQQMNDAEINWNITQSAFVKPRTIIVCCVYVN